MGISPSPILPHGYYQTAYTQLLTVEGGTAPYGYRFGGFPCDTLPASFAITDYGLLFGVPDTVRTYNFCVVVTDANGCECVFQLELEIKGVCNSAMSLSQTCPTNPLITATAMISEDSYCGPAGTDQRTVDAQAIIALNNQMATAMAAAGCGCVYTTDYAGRSVTVVGGCTLFFQVQTATGPVPPPSVFAVTAALSPFNFAMAYNFYGGHPPLGPGWFRILPPYGEPWWFYYPGGGP